PTDRRTLVQRHLRAFATSTVGSQAATSENLQIGETEVPSNATNTGANRYSLREAGEIGLLRWNGTVARFRGWRPHGATAVHYPFRERGGVLAAGSARTTAEDSRGRLACLWS